MPPRAVKRGIRKRCRTKGVAGDVFSARWHIDCRVIPVLEKPEPEGGHTLSENRFQFDEAEENRMSELEHIFRYGTVRDMERLMIMRRLVENDQNRTRTAKTLEISVRTIRNKLRLYRELDVVYDDATQVGVPADL